MKYSLNGEWSLKGYEHAKTAPSLELTAKVPGNVELDLYRAGIEPEPFYGANEYLYRRYESWSWRFEREIDLPSAPDTDAFLVFEGLNCVSEVYLDGVKLGHFENALIPCRVPLEGVLPGAHALRVDISSALMRARDDDLPVSATAAEGSDEYTRLRMPPHSFGWDIMPRFPSAGMWRDVYIEMLPKTRFTQVYFATRAADSRRADVVFRYRFTTPDTDPAGYQVAIKLDGREVVRRQASFVSGGGSFSLDQPRLWWPRGYGEAYLYDARIELIRQGEVVDAYSCRLGIREIRIDHKMAPGDEGEFLVRVNGRRVFLMGSNWVPMDAFHSRDPERYDRAVALWREANCNILRMWGGNVYEADRVYDLCDESGILVWQDFAMACAVYSQQEEFARVIAGEAEQVIRRLRNHACVLLWSGDNEVDETYSGRGYWPDENRFNSVTRLTLPRVVRENDPFRMFLPSSPFIDGGIARYSVPEQHLWGPRAWFKDDFYRHTSAHFVSECGYHGCPAPRSLKRFIPENELGDFFGESWTAHSSEYVPLFRRGYSRNKLMLDQLKLMFGRMPDSLEEISFLSQFTQAEAFKFFIETARVHAWRRTGLIWWNMLDGWPQISDAVVDWYFEKKRAFHTIKRSQEPVLVLLDEPQGWYQDVVISNFTLDDASVSLRLWDADTGETLFEGVFSCPAGSNLTAGSIRVFSSWQRLILIEYDSGEGKKMNHYLSGFPVYRPEDAVRWAKMIDGETP
ncbi:MAG: hypothetical protein K5663_06070 [Clostridiales bacterium]|nr:hypothetical protein [Clostridiales bacterium]